MYPKDPAHPIENQKPDRQRNCKIGQPSQLFAEISRMFADVNQNTDGEITVRIKNIGDARRLMEFIFGQAGYEPNAASKIVSRSGGKKTLLSKAAAAEQLSELFPDDAASRETRADPVAPRLCPILDRHAEPAGRSGGGGLFL